MAISPWEGRTFERAPHSIPVKLDLRSLPNLHHFQDLHAPLPGFMLGAHLNLLLLRENPQAMQISHHAGGAQASATEVHPCKLWRLGQRRELVDGGNHSSSKCLCTITLHQSADDTLGCQYRFLFIECITLLLTIENRRLDMSQNERNQANDISLSVLLLQTAFQVRMYIPKPRDEKVVKFSEPLPSGGLKHYK
jgi:hypothetical protein